MEGMRDSRGGRLSRAGARHLARGDEEKKERKEGRKEKRNEEGRDTRKGES